MCVLVVAFGILCLTTFYKVSSLENNDKACREATYHKTTFSCGETTIFGFDVVIVWFSIACFVPILYGFLELLRIARLIRQEYPRGELIIWSVILSLILGSFITAFLRPGGAIDVLVQLFTGWR
jgi:hypothetical protein